MLKSNSKLTVGGYGEVHYNQDLDSDNYKNANLDVHRIVLLFGYNFNERTKIYIRGRIRACERSIY